MKFLKRTLVFFTIWSATSTHAVVLEQLARDGQLQSILENDKKCYYIGSFDPLHLGHEEVTRIVIEKDLCNYVIIYPLWGGDNSKNRIPVSYRLKMLYNTFKDNPRIITTFLPPKQLQELITKISVSNKLENNHNKNTEFIGIIGSELALWFGIKKDDYNLELARKDSLKTYLRAKPINYRYARHGLGTITALQVNKFIVFQRSEPEQLLLNLNGKIADRPIVAIINSNIYKKLSSTDVKNAIKNKQRIEGMVPLPVYYLIQEYNLYQNESSPYGWLPDGTSCE